MEGSKGLKKEILDLTSAYSKQVHSAFRPEGDIFKKEWEEGNVIYSMQLDAIVPGYPR